VVCECVCGVRLQENPPGGHGELCALPLRASVQIKPVRVSVCALKAVWRLFTSQREGKNTLRVIITLKQFPYKLRIIKCTDKNKIKKINMTNSERKESLKPFSICKT